MASVEEVKAEIKAQAAEDEAAGKISFLGSIVNAVEKEPENAEVLFEGASTPPAHPSPPPETLPRRSHASLSLSRSAQPPRS